MYVKTTSHTQAHRHTILLRTAGSYKHTHTHTHRYTHASIKRYIHEETHVHTYTQTHAQQTHMFYLYTNPQAPMRRTRVIWITSPSACTHMMGKLFASIWPLWELNPHKSQLGAFPCVSLHFGANVRQNSRDIWLDFDTVARTVWVWNAYVNVVLVCAGMEHMAILRASIFLTVKETLWKSREGLHDDDDTHWFESHSGITDDTVLIFECKVVLIKMYLKGPSNHTWSTTGNLRATISFRRPQPSIPKTLQASHRRL